MKTSAAVFLLVAALGHVIMTPAACAWSGRITSPSLGAGEEADLEAVGKALEYLQKECGFKEGGFFNAYQWMDFTGPVERVPKLLRLLKAAGIDAAISSARLGQPDVAFRITQGGWSGKPQSRLILNLDYPRVNHGGVLERLGLEASARPGVKAEPAGR